MEMKIADKKEWSSAKCLIKFLICQFQPYSKLQAIYNTKFNTNIFPQSKVYCNFELEIICE